MKNECGIIRDLLPLYAEHIASDESVEFVEEHLKTCDACREELERMKESKPIDTNTLQENAGAASLMKLRQKMRTKKIQTVAVTALLVIALLVSAIGFLTSPIYFPYSKNVISVTENDDNSATFVFDMEVTGYDIDIYEDPYVEGSRCYQISAWTSLWDKWFSNKGNMPLSFTEAYQMATFYVSNNGKENVCIYNISLADPNSSVTSLPRLSLGYYFIIAAALFALLLAARIIFRKKESAKVWIERIMLYPLSYVISHFFVRGFSFTTYSLSRDFALIMLISLLLWCGMLLAHNIFKNRREIKEMSKALEEQK